MTTLYGGGQSWSKYGNDPWAPGDGGGWQRDYGFRSHVAPVPLPPALPLFAATPAGLLRQRRRC